MKKYIVIDKNKLTKEDQETNKAVLLWKDDSTLGESNQYVLRINEKNESQFRSYIKYDEDSIRVARINKLPLPEVIENPNVNLPFASKVLSDGKKIYKRIHGKKLSINNETKNTTFLVPYNNCKITGLEILNGSFGDICNLKVLDTPTGTISSVPDLVLNQFGYGVNVSKDYHKETSNYDADLIKDMQLVVEYTTSEDKEVYFNFILHEVK